MHVNVMSSEGVVERGYNDNGGGTHANATPLWMPTYQR